MSAESFSLISLTRKINSEKEAISFLQEYGIIHKKRFCQKKHLMHLKIHAKNTRWVCKKSCCKSEIAIRKNTWLSNSRLSFDTIIFFIYAWSQKYTPKFCEREFKMSATAITDWKNYLREVCANSLLKNKNKIGGPGMTVEIDESCFSKRKYNVGRILPQQWVFGGM